MVRIMAAEQCKKGSQRSGGHCVQLRVAGNDLIREWPRYLWDPAGREQHWGAGCTGVRTGTKGGK
jgi:hypothetical protein